MRCGVFPLVLMTKCLVPLYIFENPVLSPCTDDKMSGSLVHMMIDESMYYLAIGNPYSLYVLGLMHEKVPVRLRSSPTAPTTTYTTTRTSTTTYTTTTATTTISTITIY